VFLIFLTAIISTYGKPNIKFFKIFDLMKTILLTFIEKILKNGKFQMSINNLKSVEKL